MFHYGLFNRLKQHFVLQILILCICMDLILIIVPTDGLKPWIEMLNVKKADLSENKKELISMRA